MKLDLPFNIGDVYYLPVHTQTEVTKTCDVCYGHRAVWFKNIKGEEFEMACSACAAPGTEYPTGVITDLEYIPQAQSFTVASIAQIGENGHYIVKSREGGVADFETLYPDEATAFAVSVREINKRHDEHIHTSECKTQRMRKQSSWSARYHRQQITYHQDRIDWHTNRLPMYKGVTTKKEPQT